MLQIRDSQFADVMQPLQQGPSVRLISGVAGATVSGNVLAAAAISTFSPLLATVAMMLLMNVLLVAGAWLFVNRRQQMQPADLDRKLVRWANRPRTNLRIVNDLADAA